MFPLWINILIAISTFFLMEGVAWATHKYIMHGLLWNWHKSHHAPYAGTFEKNDLFGLVFSVPAAASIMAGIEFAELRFLLWVGMGITAYGIFYVLFHDVLVHQRIKHGLRPENKYLRRMIRAHKIHHKCTTKEGAEAFGFLYAPPKYEASVYKSKDVKQSDLIANQESRHITQ
ncbi:sterol desaturase family protein [Xanthocytophaga flava]|uniref:sterol desaturase family protein n=1 Tax=Xanthocytophaga flava TaxID=3048013 RepID=UPI0028D6610D|nr:sterol desaturase family protein [Xanthocytophaga flavus]